MPLFMVRHASNAALAATALVLLSACAPSPAGNMVAVAYDSSGSVAIPAYTRTIFSTNNF